jgi:hypothetical protein
MHFHLGPLDCTELPDNYVAVRFTEPLMFLKDLPRVQTESNYAHSLPLVAELNTRRKRKLCNYGMCVRLRVDN